MINTNILKSLESSFQDPSYSIIISNFEQKEFCNKDKLRIYMQQFSPNLEKIIENKESIIEELKSVLTENDIPIPDLYELKINNCIQKTLNIESVLDYDTDNLFISRLTGSLENENEKEASRYLEGNIKNNRVKITLNDIPNYFNRSKFRIKESQLIVSIPKKIKAFRIELQNLNTEEILTYDESNLDNNKVFIDISPSHEYFFKIRYETKDSLLIQDIESITTPLATEVELEFQNKYKNLPAIILTIDEDNKVYSSYTTNFTQDSNNCYTGVTISFNNLKKQKKYGDINITIIGNEISD